MDDELIELVDDHDKVIGTILRSEANKQNLLNFRAIYVWLVNSKGQIFVPKRAKNKKLYPGGYDFSVAGQLAVDETYEKALHREVKEELKLNIDDYKRKEIVKLTPKENGVACFVKLYELRADVEPNFNTEDIESAEWLTPKQILM